jgi:hypothetical protein
LFAPAQERRRRKEAEEIFANKLAAKDAALAAKDDEMTQLREEMKRMEGLVGRSNALVESLRSERRDSVQRTRSVVMNPGGDGEGGGQADRREVQRAWNGSPATAGNESDGR